MKNFAALTLQNPGSAPLRVHTIVESHDELRLDVGPSD